MTTPSYRQDERDELLDPHGNARKLNRLGSIASVDVELGRLAAEADAYFTRNDGRESQPDYVFEALAESHGRQPVGDLLEVGCMDGSRLARATEALNCRATGIEASELAVKAAHERFPGIRVKHGVAPLALEELIGVEDFDAVIVGFFLYLLPRSLLFRAVAGIDALLRDGGFLILSDFLSPLPVRREYEHDRGLSTFKSDYAQAWTWNPQYVLISRTLKSHSALNDISLHDEKEWLTVDVLYKRPRHEAYMLK